MKSEKESQKLENAFFLKNTKKKSNVWHKGINN